MSNLYIITGPAGVGKSSTSKRLAKDLKRSVLIEGDQIYNQVIGGYISPWEKGNHLTIFWKICLDMISTYLWEGYDVVFNYIVTPEQLGNITRRFTNFEIKFVVLLANEESLYKRDKQRPLDCQMGERCIVLLNDFKKTNYKITNILDNSNLSIDEVVKEIEKNKRFTVK